MGLLDNYTGIGMSPRPTVRHQDVILSLAMAIKETIDEDEQQVLTECVVNVHDLSSQAPDVILYDLPSYKPVLIIEVTTTKERKRIAEKVKDLVKEYPSIQEAFVYDYEKELWTRFDGQSEMTDDPSYSTMLEIDFDDYL